MEQNNEVIWRRERKLNLQMFLINGFNEWVEKNGYEPPVAE